jgi:hypothetical protein
LVRRFQDAAIDFIAAPALARPLAALRIGVSAVLLVQALAMAASVLDLFGPLGVVQWMLNDAMNVPGMPHVRWFARLLAPLGATEAGCTQAVFLLYVAGLSALLVGWHSRVAAGLTWFTHLALMMSGRSSLYGVDDFANIALFYCLVMPVGRYWSLDVQAGRASAAPSFEARLGLRVLQIHLCAVYLSSGIEKAITPPYQWLDGDVIWRTAMLPEYRHFDLTWLADYPLLAMLAAWGSLVIEIGYAFFVWPRATRRPWALATVGLHLGIAVMMGLVSFGALMIVLTSSAFLFSPEPREARAIA